MRRPLTTFALLLLVGACAAETPLEELSGLLQGRFDSHLPGTTSDEPLDQRIIDSRQLAVAPELGSLVMYLQLNRGAELALYRQRILVFEERADGTILQHAYALREPALFEDASMGDAVLGDLTPEDIDPVFTDGCEQVWSRTTRGFRGYVDPQTCVIISSRTGKPRRIEGETVVSADQLTLVERGYDPEFNQLFGTPQGERTLLQRMPE